MFNRFNDIKIYLLYRYLCSNYCAALLLAIVYFDICLQFQEFIGGYSSSLKIYIYRRNIKEICPFRTLGVKGLTA